MDFEQHNRTWLCTVVFTDIVDYSTHPVDRQIEIKGGFNRLLSDAVKGVAEDELIILDTGDGAALSFLGDPEEALFSAVRLRDALSTEDPDGPESFSARIGIHLGPVKVVRDINGRMNIIGDGINVAQRIMSFSGPNQILVSRSFYDVAWCLSQEYSELFKYVGSRKDKHIREHLLYEVVRPGRKEKAAAPQVEEGEVTSIDLDALDGGIEEQTMMLASRLVQSAPKTRTRNWEPEALRKIENELSEFVGPVAKLIVRRASHADGTIEDLCHRVAPSIADGERRTQFLSKVSNDISRENKADTGDTSQPPSPAWDAEKLKSIELHLARRLGPLAGVLVRRAAQHATDYDDLCAVLAEEISDPREAGAFLQNARKTIGQD